MYALYRLEDDLTFKPFGKWDENMRELETQMFNHAGDVLKQSFRYEIVENESNEYHLFFGTLLYEDTNALVAFLVKEV